MIKINKKGQQQSNAGAYAVLAIAGFVAVILILYFLSKILVTLGWVFLLIAMIIAIAGAMSENEEVLILGGIFLIIGLICLGAGYTGVNFFEHNPTGQNLLGSANSVVNATKEGVSTYNQLTRI